MAPFGSSDSSFYDSLPPLEEGPKATETPAGESLFEGLAKLRKLYRLALVDDEGTPVSYPSDADLTRLIAKPERSPRAPPSPLTSPQQQQAAPAEQQPKEPLFQTLLAESTHKGGPVCSHCGATESPQWRRGPPNKAILCNACGTRYRRTNQLGSSVPSTQRKRGAQHCASEALKSTGHPAKQPRVVA